MPLFDFFKKQEKPKSQPVDITSKLITEELKEIDVLIEKASKLGKEKLNQVWQTIFDQLEAQNRGKPLFRQFDFTSLKNYVAANKDYLPLDAAGGFNFIMDAFPKLKQDYRLFYIDKFLKFADVAKVVYESQANFLGSLTDILYELNYLKQTLIEFRNQPKADTARMEERRLTNIKTVIANVRMELHTVENDLDTLATMKAKKKVTFHE